MDNILIFLNRVRGPKLARRLHNEGHGILALIGDRDRLDIADAEEVARDIGARVIEAPENVNETAFVEQVAALKPRITFIAGYNKIFKRPLIEAAEIGTFNLHTGTLPRYRGGSPLNWQIINGEDRAGVAVIRIDEGIDTGPIVAEAEIEIENDDTIATLHDKADAVFCNLIVEVLRGIEHGGLQERAQDESLACYWHQRNDDDGRILWRDLTARQVHDLVRAVTRPYPGAWSMCGESKFRIFETRIPAEIFRGIPGRVVSVGGRGPYVICRDQGILISDYSPKGKHQRLRLGDHLE